MSLGHYRQPIMASAASITISQLIFVALVILQAAQSAQCSSAFSLGSPSLAVVKRQLPNGNYRRHTPSTSSSALFDARTTPASDADTSSRTVTIFDFSSTSSSTGGNDVSSFERIDDAIMGGISLSALRDVPNTNYASWSGICRTDGGGFCGMRTVPFREPLDATGCDGVFVDCRLASDDEPHRRVWKITLRTDTSRGEMVYQAAFPLLATSPPDGISDDGTAAAEVDFARVMVPFDDFQLVRGPRVVPGAPKLNATGGIYQVGMSLSKFVIGVNTTELENFRPGFFDLHVARIGFYCDEASKKDEDMVTSISVDTLSKEEVEKKRPVLLKILLPISKLFFSEKANRRKSAMGILKKRGMSRLGAVRWGIKSRGKSYGILTGVASAAAIIAIDSFRTVLRTALKICLFYPFVVVGRAIKLFKKYILRMKVKEMPQMTE
mmetsp:Transcript_15868/g.34480  ORF Transcript_15868/g.34480 Transcript_15868/m.34480 type:complete len:438 (-) Transcript_15868:80-1393(-)